MPDPTTTHAGYVALVGRPNVGQSTLLNALVGEKLSIVTSRAQTTRDRIFGILTTDEWQIIFVDTPGLLEPKYRMQQSMLETALAAIGDADVVLLLLDATRPDELPSADVLEVLLKKGNNLVVAINKTDQAAAPAVESLAGWARRELGREPLRCSALRKKGLKALQRELVSKLPASPFFYPADDLAIQPVRFFVEELIRETIFEQYEDEIPYSTVARIEEFREDRTPVYIRATVYVERESQKGIVVGNKGVAIRELGKVARGKIEAFIGGPVYLDLWIKAMPNWRNQPSALKFLGYPIPERDRQ